MNNIGKKLLPEEEIIFQTKKHLIIFFFPVLWIIFSFFATGYMMDSPILIKVIWAPWVVGILFFLSVWIAYATSCFAVTNKRLIMQEGFFSRHANEMRLSAISQVNIDQTLLGRICGYGTVTINAFGAFDAFTVVSKPNTLQQAINAEIDKVAK